MVYTQKLPPLFAETLKNIKSLTKTDNFNVIQAGIF